jgi:hypothetical protein
MSIFLGKVGVHGSPNLLNIVVNWQPCYPMKLFFFFLSEKPVSVLIGKVAQILNFGWKAKINLHIYMHAKGS